MKIRSLIAAALASLLALVGPVAAQDRGTGIYLSTGFIDYAGFFNLSSEQKLRLFMSPDGKAFGAVSPFPIYSDPQQASGCGGVRDPSAVPWAGGWLFAYTNGDTGCVANPNYSVASFLDLQNFNSVVNVPNTCIANAYQTWAPELFIDADGSLHILEAISTNGSTSNFNIYEAHPTAFDAQGFPSAWSCPTMLSGLPTNLIDPYELVTGTTHYLFAKNDTTLAYEVFSSASLTGPYSLVNANVTPNGQDCEGGSVVPVDRAGTFRFYCDQRADQGQRWSESSDLFATWTTLAPVANVESQYYWNHGTVLRITDTAAVQQVLALHAVMARPVGATIWRGSGSQSIPNNSITALTATASGLDIHGFTNIGSAPSKITARAPGWYQLCGDIGWTGAGTNGFMELLIRITQVGSGSQYFGGHMMGQVNPTGGATQLSTCTQQFLSVGDVAEAVADQTSGGAISAYWMNLNAILQGGY